MSETNYTIKQAVLHMDECVAYLKEMGFKVRLYSSPASIYIRNRHFKIPAGDFTSMKILCGRLAIPFPAIESEDPYTWIQMLYTMPADSIAIRIFIKISKGRYRRLIQFSKNPITLLRLVDIIKKSSEHSFYSTQLNKKSRFWNRRDRAKKKSNFKGKKIKK